MDSRDRDPPNSSGDPSLGDAPASSRVTAAHPAVDAPAAQGDSPAEAAMRAALTAYASRPENLAAIHKKVARKVPANDVDDVVQVAVEKAISSKSLPSAEASIPAWIRTVVRRAIARYYRQKQAREEREGLTDQIDQFVDPRTEVGWNVDGFLILPWLEKEVAGHDRDEELLDILVEKASTGKTYEALAAKHGMTLAALSSRIFQFKKKYGPRYKRYKESVILLLVGAVLAAIGLVLWLLLHARAPRSVPQPPPSALPAAPAVTPPANDPGNGVAHPRP